MANFKTHIGWGVFIGVGFVVACLLYSMIFGMELIVGVFLAVIIGSFLPDLDLDGGVPFQILFGLLAMVIAGIVFFDLYQSGNNNWKGLIFFPILTFVTVRFIGGFIFENFTNHRGMFHSIPAAILSGLIVFWLLNSFSEMEVSSSFFIGLAIIMGYLGHLVLDEIYSSVNLSGYSLFPKQSLGSALKLYSSSRIATVFVYFLIVFLVSYDTELKKIVTNFWS
ncbi:MAG: metal-dependent hydrolase [Candidatus Moraniibacteriota bacterium]